MCASAGHLTAFTLVCATPDNGNGTVRISATAESFAVDENRFLATTVSNHPTTLGNGSNG